MLSSDVLKIDVAAETTRICDVLREQVLGNLRRKGIVVGVSGGIDSAVVAALATRALGADRVLGLFMPEHDSSPDALRLGQQLQAVMRFPALVENVAATLEAAGCYARQAEAIRQVVPEYGPGWKCKLVLPSILEGDRLNVTRLTVENPAGDRSTYRMTASSYLQMVAATNFKQRVRKMMEYYHADRLAYAVAGTPNRLEYDQGFFVKLGDGAGDIKPIAHLYKSQVFALAEHLGVPEQIRRRPPTTDTFSLPQSQEEFYFSLPHDQMDLCLFGFNHGVPPGEVAPALGVTAAVVERVYRDIESKRRATRYLHLPPLLVEQVLDLSRPPVSTGRTV
jgi:NAD+ synthase